MPDMRSQPSPETYHVPLIWSGTLPCSPNSLPMVSKAISTLGSQTSSPVAVNVWPLMEFSHSLFLSRLEFLKAVFWALLFFWVSLKYLSDSLENPLYLFADDSTLYRTICQPSDRQATPSSLSADLDNITSWSNTWNMSFNPDKSHSHYVSPNGPFETPPSTFSTILWKKSFHSSFWVSLSAMISPGKATFPTWSPKPVADWVSSVV